LSAVIALVGRPNTGKSTLFNRLIGKRKAIESNIPGTTRDRLYESFFYAGHKTLLVDTGGIELDNTGDIEADVQEQSKLAIEGADLIFFLVDVKEELTSEDFHAADLLRRSKKPVILIANKCDNPSLGDDRFNLYELGFGEPIAVSALHAGGLDHLEKLTNKELETLGLPADDSENDEFKDHIKIAFLGRPNVGKSTMVNALFGKKRVVVSDVPGTTRDAAEVPFVYDDKDYLLIDTAGVRRRGKIEKGIEKYSILRTMQSISQADVCVLMLDFETGIANQDCHVSQYILEERKGLIIVVNKVDLESGDIRESLTNNFIGKLKHRMAYVPWAPVVFSSAKERKNIFQILNLAAEISNERVKEVSQEDLNVWLDIVLTKHPPRGRKGKREFSVLSVKQIGSGPPSFEFECVWPEIMHFSYARFLENELRSQFGFTGTPVHLKFKKAKFKAIR
jgi:GTPase